MQDALDKIPEIQIVNLTPGKGGGTGSIKVPKDFDYKACLDRIASADDHFAGWSEGE